ncbi:MAG: peptidoglycan DD-metalloendopeptidase family protein, partial [candidate division Zixibacteria bacterium]|nr:peptidoglycan DD-metalloendopeptidase family protein [candidate division Zixibacteria bacterium]
MRKLPLFLLSLFLLTVSISAQKNSDQLESQKKELERIKAELESKRGAVDKLKQEEKGVLSELAGVEEELDLVNTLIRKMRGRESSLIKKISRSNLELWEQDVRLNEKRKHLAYRLNQTYRYGRGYQTQFLLTAESPVEFLKRYYYLQKMTDKDRELISTVTSSIQTIESGKSQLQSDLDELGKLRSEKSKEEKNRQKVRTQKEKLLGNIRQEKKLQTQAIADLEESRSQIQGIIEKLQAEAAKIPSGLPEGVFASYRGKMDWPVSGDILSTYGQKVDPANQTVTFNSGIVIKADAGEYIHAVADGYLIYQGWLRGYGRFIILQHDSGFYTLYAHLNDVLAEDGSMVRSGDA